jgi:hypothetical protein
MSALTELADRCEQAAGPDRDIDGMIGAIVGCEFHSAEAVREYAHDDHAWGSEGPHWAGTANSLGVLKFTASLDAAVTLIDDDVFFHVSRFSPESGSRGEAHVYPNRRLGDDYEAEAATPALALCAAALRARARRLPS